MKPPSRPALAEAMDAAAELTDTLAAMLAAIERDELTASVAFRYRLEGALTALEVALGRRSSLLEALEAEDTDDTS